ncbi:MAG: serine/threonine protein kinase [Bacteroidales bacterium]|nr:serine/threonine protein kinase [Bacteroidales bacterium]
MTQDLPQGMFLQGSTYRYKIVRTLGQGTFGITYLATTQMTGPLGAINVRVAIKEFFMKEINMREGSSVTGGSNSKDGLFDKYRQKFRREAHNLSSMQHPGIVKVIESFETNGTSYIVMDFLGGGSLNDLINRRGVLPENEALQYIRSIGSAISYMHSHHMLHLDLKPSNVMLNDMGEPVVIDFGLSKQYGDDGSPESSTSVGGGTPGYAPIEQASYHEGKGFPVTIDIYALGATLFKMLTGRRAPEADEIMNDGFPYGTLKGVSQPTVAALAKAMAFRKADRYQSVDEFLAALGKASVADEATSFVSSEATNIVSPIAPPPLPKQENKGPESEKTQLNTDPVPKPSPRQPYTPAPKKKSNAGLWVLLALLAIGLVVFATLYVVNSKDNEEAPMVEPETFVYDEDRAREVVETYCKASLENDYSTLEKLYAPHVERYINIKTGLSRDSVMAHHYRIDSFYKIRRKKGSIRKGTFKCKLVGEDRIEAEIIQDYSFDNDPGDSKTNIFVLKKLFVLNKDYQIVSVDEKYLERKRGTYEPSPDEIVVDAYAVREQDIADAAEQICNCSSDDRSRLAGCLSSIISTGYAAYTNDREFADAVYSRALSCIAEKAVNRAADEAAKRIIDLW